MSEKELKKELELWYGLFGTDDINKASKRLRELESAAEKYWMGEK